MKYFVYLVFLFSLIGCTSKSVTYLDNGSASSDCSSSVEINSNGITMTDECSPNGEAVKQIKLE